MHNFRFKEMQYTCCEEYVVYNANLPVQRTDVLIFKAIVLPRVILPFQHALKVTLHFLRDELISEFSF